MTQIRIQCPNCATQGKLDSSALPDGGANIRCPACSVIFFVGGPSSDDPTVGRAPVSDGDSPVAGSDPTGVSGSAQAVPPAGPSGSQSAVGEPAAEPTPTPAPTPEPAAAAPVSPAEPAPEPAPAEPPPSPAAEPPPSPAAEPAATPAPAAGARVTVPKLSIPGMESPAPSAPVQAPAEAPAAPQAPQWTPPPADVRATPEPVTETPSHPPQPRITSTAGEQVSIPSTLSQPSVPSSGYAAVPRSTTSPPTTIPPVGDQAPTIPIPRVAGAEPARNDRVTPDSEARTSFRVTSRTGSRRVVVADDGTSTSGSYGAAIGDYSAHIGSWRVRAGTGMVYDFPDTESLRAWLESRPSLDDLAASVDGGVSFKPLAEWPELADVGARGVRGASTGRVGPLGISAPGVSGEAPTRRRQRRSGASDALGSSLGSRVSTSDSPAASRSTRRTRRAPRDASERKSIARQVTLVVLLLAVAVAAFGYRRIQQPPRLPDTLAGRELGWVLGVINGGSAALSEIEVTNHFAPSALEQVPAARIIQELEFWDDRFPAYTLLHVNSGWDETHLVIVVDTPFQETGEIEIALEPDPPHRITEFLIR